jgi:hypothetical protein
MEVINVELRLNDLCSRLVQVIKVLIIVYFQFNDRRNRLEI